MVRMVKLANGGKNCDSWKVHCRSSLEGPPVVLAYKRTRLHEEECLQCLGGYLLTRKPKPPTCSWVICSQERSRCHQNLKTSTWRGLRARPTRRQNRLSKKYFVSTSSGKRHALMTGSITTEAPGSTFNAAACPHEGSITTEAPGSTFNAAATSAEVEWPKRKRWLWSPASSWIHGM